MQGRKDYTREEIDAAREALDAQLGAYRRLVAALDGSDAAAEARTAFEAHFFNTLTLVLDRYFVHRLAGPRFEGKDGNPLNEVRIIADSLLHDGVMRADNQVKLPPDRSVTGLAVGDRIELGEQDYERLSAAFLDELERRFLPVAA